MRGVSWATLSSTIPADQRYYSWFVPAATSTPTAQLRLSRNGTALTHTSGNFVINKYSNLTAAAPASQCPGYLNFTWPVVTGATSYKVLQKIGFELAEVATVAAPVNTYLAKNLSPDSFYTFSVQPMFGTTPGLRTRGPAPSALHRYLCPACF